jgi:hypothetical protein
MEKAFLSIHSTGKENNRTKINDTSPDKQQPPSLIDDMQHHRKKGEGKKIFCSLYFDE